VVFEKLLQVLVFGCAYWRIAFPNVIIVGRLIREA